MQYSFFVGVDVSKATLDVAYCHQNTPEQFFHRQFANDLAGCKQLLQWLKKQKVSLDTTFLCMEHTGWYTLELCCFLQEHHVVFALYSPLHLKKSIGIVRGKMIRWMPRD
ncbi:MAG: transposase [Bacteroidota bacterium]